MLHSSCFNFAFGNFNYSKEYALSKSVDWMNHPMVNWGFKNQEIQYHLNWLSILSTDACLLRHLFEISALSLLGALEASPLELWIGYWYSVIMKKCFRRYSWRCWRKIVEFAVAECLPQLVAGQTPCFLQIFGWYCFPERAHALQQFPYPKSAFAGGCFPKHWSLSSLNDSIYLTAQRIFFDFPQYPFQFVFKSNSKTVLFLVLHFQYMRPGNFALMN